jgi:hypothetical protein
MTAPSSAARRWAVAGAFVALAGAVPGAAHAAAGDDATLSNERMHTTWAHPRRAAVVHAGPAARSPRLGRLRTRTEDRLPEVSLLLRSARAADGRTWVQLRVAGRPNGRVGWVPRDALGAFHVVDTELIVDRATARVTLRRAGRRVWSAPAGVGAPATPTPAGHFWVREIFRVVPRTPLYGPYAIGTSDYSVLTDWPGGGVIGLHGTDQPALIPGRPSHGCVRLRNRDVTALVRAQRLPVGTPVLIR